MTLRERLAAWRAALEVYRDRRILTVLALGFASGMPLLLTLSTLSAWLKESGVDKTTIGLFALVGMPYSVKFAWSPVIDRVRLPLLGRLGRRRGWAIATQIGLIASVLAMAATDPSRAPSATALCALLVAFFSASQDIVLDAYRIELTASDERYLGVGASVYITGYRLGMLASGAGALVLAEALGWRVAYAVMAGLVLVGVATVLASTAPGVSASLPPSRPGVLAWLNASVVAPFRDFLRRPGWLAVLLFVLLYKLGDALAGVMAMPFYLEMEFTKPEIASISKVFGLVATIAGGLMGGALVGRYGIGRSLVVCGALQAASNLMFALQATVGHDLAFLTATIAIENLSGGMGTAASVAYISSLCNVAYTATQFALLSSLSSVGRTTLSASGGWLAERLGWVDFFVLTTVAALPGLALFVWMRRRYPPPAPAAATPARG